MKEDEEQHRTEVVSQASGTRWTVECSCGYQAGPFINKLDAMNEADDHVLSVTN